MVRLVNTFKIIKYTSISDEPYPKYDINGSPTFPFGQVVTYIIKSEMIITSSNHAQFCLNITSPVH